MKTTKQKAFKLMVDKSKPDSLVMKCVEFEVDDEDYGETNMNQIPTDYGSNISQNFGDMHKIEAIIKRKVKKKYITGTVICMANKYKSNVVSYKVQWEDNALGKTPNELAVLIPTIGLAIKLNRHPKNDTTHKRKKRTDGLRSEEEPTGDFFINEMCDELFLVYEGGGRRSRVV